MAGIFPDDGKPPGTVCNGFSPNNSVTGGGPFYADPECATVLRDCNFNAIVSELLAAVDIGLDVPFNSTRIDNLGRALRERFDLIDGQMLDLDDRKVERSGDTMTGPLELPGDPTAPLQAATKAYVDFVLGTAGWSAAIDALRDYVDQQDAALRTEFMAANALLQANKVNRAGDTMTGPLILSRNPVLPMEAAPRVFVEMLAGAGVITAPFAPPAQENSLWFNSTNGSLAINYNDGNSLQWVTIVGPAGPPGGMVIVSPTAPNNPANNDLWWDSVGGQLYIWFNDGTTAQWVAVISAWGGVVGLAAPLLGSDVSALIDQVNQLSTRVQELEARR